MSTDVSEKHRLHLQREKPAEGREQAEQTSAPVCGSCKHSCRKYSNSNGKQHSVYSLNSICFSERKLLRTSQPRLVLLNSEQPRLVLLNSEQPRLVLLNSERKRFMNIDRPA
jgi:hypothetical protein